MITNQNTHTQMQKKKKPKKTQNKTTIYIATTEAPLHYAAKKVSKIRWCVINALIKRILRL